MHRSELKKVAEGLKASRPNGKNDVEGSPERCGYETWKETVIKVADALELKDKPRSNFLAAAGLTHTEGHYAEVRS